MKLTWLNNYLKMLPWLAFIGGCMILIVLLIKFAVRFRSWKSLLERKLVFLELTPPAYSNRPALATQQLFSVLHGHRSSRSRKDKLLTRQISMATEIPASREEGIRYVIQVEKRLAASVEQALSAHIPDLKVKEVTDTLPELSTKSVIVEFKQTGHYAFPLASHISLDQHDPMSYLDGAMTKLGKDEHITWQLILTPVKLREAASLSHKILGNEDVLNELVGHSSLSGLSKISKAINSILFSATDMVGEVYHGSTNESYKASQKDAHDRLQVAKRLRPARTLSAFELELMESIHRKVSQPLYRVSIRARIDIDDEAKTKERISTLISSLETYSIPGYQGLKPKMNLPYMNRYKQFIFKNRFPALLPKRDCVLSASEVASLYHFPLGKNSRTDNLVTSLSPTLPPPLSLKRQDTVFDVALGRNSHRGEETTIGLTDKERERHLYIIGGTGNGKTTMLQFAIVQDMLSGKGLAVIDPHGDMAETLLKQVPENRVDDVVYFNPDDLDYPIGLNLLELTPGLTGNALLREKDLITESVISVFRKIFSEEDTGGHRIEYVLRNTIQTALTIEGSTLFTIYDLLNDKDFRKKIIKTLDNKDLVNFWKNELGKAGEFQRVKMAAGITAKIGRFLFSASAKQILEQPRSTIKFDDIINSGKILICNFSKGLLGEDTSELFGITILAKLQLASLRRARIEQENRRPFYLYVDEFQNFATASFVQMLSESRKYKLFMTMAEQSTSQQKDQQMVNVILANVGTVICFRTGNPADERLLLPLFTPTLSNGDISNLSAFNFYARLSSMKAQEPLSGETVLLKDEGSRDIAETVIELSRKNYALTSDEKPEGLSPDVLGEEDIDDVKFGRDALPDEAS